MKRETKKLTRKYRLLGRMTARSSWYGLGQHTSLKALRKQYRRCIRKGWSENNLFMVCDETVTCVREILP